MSKPIFWLMVIGYVTLFGVIYWLAYLLRFGFDVPAEAREIYLRSLPWLLGVKLLVFYAFGHYHGWQRLESAADLRMLIWACVLAFFVVGAVDYFIFSYHVPRGIWILDGLLSIVVLETLRMNWRVAREQPVS